MASSAGSHRHPQRARGEDPVPGVDLEIRGPLGAEEVSRVCEWLFQVAAQGPIVCTVHASIRIDLTTVDSLARAVLSARRIGRTLRFRRADDDLRELVSFVGLQCVLEIDPPSGIEAGRQTEAREQQIGVEEEADPGDQPV